MFLFSCHSFACESALKTTGFLQFGFAFTFYFSMLFSFGLSKWFNIRNMRWWKDSNSIPSACIQRSHTSMVAHIWCVFISIYLNLITFNLFFFDLTSSIRSQPLIHPHYFDKISIIISLAWQKEESERDFIFVCSKMNEVKRRWHKKGRIKWSLTFHKNDFDSIDRCIGRSNSTFY